MPHDAKSSLDILDNASKDDLRALEYKELIDMAVVLRSKDCIYHAKIVWELILDKYKSDIHASLVVIHSAWDVEQYQLALEYSSRVFNSCGEEEPFLLFTLYDSILLACNTDLLAGIFATKTANASKNEVLFLKYIEYDQLRAKERIDYSEYRKLKLLFEELMRDICDLPESSVSLICSKGDFSCISLCHLVRLLDLAKNTKDLPTPCKTIYAQIASVDTYSRPLIKPRRYLVSTMPKAGTHLFSKILEQSGLSSSSWFLEYSRLIVEISDNPGANRIANYGYFRDRMDAVYNVFSVDIEKALAILPDKRFALTHIMPNHIPRDWLHGNNTFLLIRDPWECIISSFFAELQLASMGMYSRDPEIDYIISCLPRLSDENCLCMWIEYFFPSLHSLCSDALFSMQTNLPNIHVVDYDQLVNLRASSDLQSKLLEAGIDPLGDFEGIMKQALSSQTPTLSVPSEMRNAFKVMRYQSTKVAQIYSKTRLDEVYSELQVYA